MTEVWAVHVVKKVGTTFAEAVFGDPDLAEAYARPRSSDAGVGGTAVTRYTLGELGTRDTVGWFVGGTACSGRVLAAQLRTR